MEQREKRQSIHLASTPAEKLSFRRKVHCVSQEGRKLILKKERKNGDSKNTHQNQDVENKISHEPKEHKKKKNNCLIISTKIWITDERDWSYSTTSNTTVLQNPAR